MGYICRLGYLDYRFWCVNFGIRFLEFGTHDVKGLLTLLHERSPSSLQIVFPLISGLGLGMLFHAPYQVFTAALKPHELATGTSAFFLVRFTGATTGLVSLGTICTTLHLPHMSTGCCRCRFLRPSVAEYACRLSDSHSKLFDSIKIIELDSTARIEMGGITRRLLFHSG